MSLDGRALVKAQLLAVARADVEEAVFSGHGQRSRNTGGADWLVVSSRLAIPYNHPSDDELTALIVSLETGLASDAMKIDGHYDDKADIAWLPFEDYDPATVIAEEVDFGLRELDPTDRHVVGLERWRASERLPADLLRMLPSPPISVAG